MAASVSRGYFSRKDRVRVRDGGLDSVLAQKFLPTREFQQKQTARGEGAFRLRRPPC